MVFGITVCLLRDRWSSEYSREMNDADARVRTHDRKTNGDGERFALSMPWEPTTVSVCQAGLGPGPHRVISLANPVYISHIIRQFRLHPFRSNYRPAHLQVADMLDNTRGAQTECTARSQRASRWTELQPSIAIGFARSPRRTVSTGCVCARIVSSIFSMAG